MISVYYDLETGGLEPHHPDIQLAAVAINDQTFEELGFCDLRIEFDIAKCDPKALETNHYSEHEWRDAVPEAEAVAWFGKWLEPFKTIPMVSRRTGNPYKVCKMVAHNAAFDGPRLQAMFKRHQAFLPADPRVRCTMQRALWLWDETFSPPPTSYKVKNLCAAYEIETGELHTALSDVRACIQLYRRMTGR